jgi:hypothetical protein
LVLLKAILACLFGLDGVLTDIARVDAERENVPVVAVDPVGCYDAYIDGKPRPGVNGHF